MKRKPKPPPPPIADLLPRVPPKRPITIWRPDGVVPPEVEKTIALIRTMWDAIEFRGYWRLIDPHLELGYDAMAMVVRATLRVWLPDAEDLTEESTVPAINIAITGAFGSNQEPYVRMQFRKLFTDLWEHELAECVRFDGGPGPHREVMLRSEYVPGPLDPKYMAKFPPTMFEPKIEFEIPKDYVVTPLKDFPTDQDVIVTAYELVIPELVTVEPT